MTESNATTAVLRLAIPILLVVATTGCQQPVEPPRVQSPNLDAAVKTAVDKATQQVQDELNSALAWGKLGMVFLANGFTSEAATCFDHAAELDRTDARWPYLQGRILVTTSPEQAATKLERAVAICGSSPAAPRLRLVELMIELNQLDKAKLHLDDVLKEFQHNPRATICTARLQLRNGNPQGCYDTLVKAEKRLASPNDGQRTSYSLLAQAAQQIGKTEEARRYEAAARNLNEPFWPDPFWMEMQEFATGQQNMLSKADVLFGTGRYAESHALLDQILTQYPNSLFGHIYKGRALIRDAKSQTEKSNVLFFYDQAIGQLEKAKSIDPESVDALFRTGVALLEKGKLQNQTPLIEQATAHFQQAIEIKPDFTAAHYNLAHCHVSKKDTTSALACLTAASEIEPDFLPARIGLSDLFLKKGDLEQAILHATAALEIDPNNTAAKKLLNLIQQRKSSM